MGYSMCMVDSSGKVVSLRKSIQQYGSVIQVDMDMNPVPLETAETNITYNYATYFYEATEGDDRFLVGGINGGIRGIYGKPIPEAQAMVSTMIERIRRKYTDKKGKWLTKTVEDNHYYDQYGCEVTVEKYLFRSLEDPIRKVSNTKVISEGDTSDYWMATAANAVKALNKLIEIMANCDDPNAVWEGD